MLSIAARPDSEYRITVKIRNIHGDATVPLKEAILTPYVWEGGSHFVLDGKCHGLNI